LNSLIDDVRATENLFSAWKHVRRSALISQNSAIRGSASEFEHQHQRHLKRFQTQLRENRFEFDGYEGVLKDKKLRLAKGKDPRPIAIGTIKNRVVQRAILQVLQPRKVLNSSDPNSRFEPKIDKRLNRLNDVNQSKFGVGGLMSPYGGVKPAIKFALSSMEQGARFFYQSDIKSFFTKIPTHTIVEKVKAETTDSELAALFNDALEVNLANKDELLSYAKLFPSKGIGVAQGSSLSAFAGNVLLYDFDRELNSMGVSAIRYIDDVLILSEKKQTLDAAVDFAQSYLGNLGFSLYPPVAGSDKAATGLCTDAFQFLGCTIQPARCVPSKGSRKKILQDIREILSKSKKEITNLIKTGEKFDTRLSRSAVIERAGKKLFGWEKSFSFCTDAQSFRILDNDVAQLVHKYEQEIERTLKQATTSVRLQAIGIPSTADIFAADQEKLVHTKPST